MKYETASEIREHDFHVDRVFIASVMFTVALLIPIPRCLEAALSRDDLIRQSGAFTSLSNILIGIFVVWTGFRKRRKWAWLIMCIIVWVGAFPTLGLPLFLHEIGPTPSEWVYDALGGPGFARAWTESVLLFVIMLLALMLPIKAFVFTQPDNSRVPPGRN